METSSGLPVEDMEPCGNMDLTKVGLKLGINRAIPFLGMIFLRSLVVVVEQIITAHSNPDKVG